MSPGSLPRTTLESHHVFPACCRGKHFCLLAVCPTFRLAYSLGVRPAFQQTLFCFILHPHSLCFPLFWGNDFSTDFRLPLWAISHNDPVHAVCWGFSTELLRELTVHIAPSYCVNWLFTLLNFVHESSRFSLCSAEHLRIVSPLPRTPTRRRQSIDVFNHDSTCRNRRHRRESTKEVHGLVVRIAPVSFSTPAIVSALDSDWTIYYLLIFN